MIRQERRLLLKRLSPFFNILMIISTLFIIVFCKITLRKISYSLYQENKKFNEVQDKYYKQLKKYGKLNRSEELDRWARHHFTEKLKKGKIIQIIDGKIAIPEEK